jgi:putative oxidoreductase
MTTEFFTPSRPASNFRKRLDTVSACADPNLVAIQFVVAVSASHFAAFFFLLQVLGGLLLLFGFFVPLALTPLAAELYNMLAFHLTMAPGSIAPALVAGVLWILVFLQYRESFKGIFSAKPATQA